MSHIYSDDIIEAFKELGFEDISYKNDLCDSIGLDISKDNSWTTYFKIYLANAYETNEEMEEFATSQVAYCPINFFNCKNDICLNDGEMFESNDIMEILSMFKSYKESK